MSVCVCVWWVSETYLKVVFAVYGEAVAENIPGHHHVGLHPVHRQPVHAQELREQRVAMTLHDKLHTIRGGGQRVERKVWE